MNIVVLSVAIIVYTAYNLKDYLDITIFTAATIILLTDFFIALLLNWAARKGEDSLKITNNYRSLMDKYPLDQQYGYFYKFNNTTQDKISSRLKRKFYYDDEAYDFDKINIFPIRKLCSCQNKK